MCKAPTPRLRGSLRSPALLISLLLAVPLAIMAARPALAAGGPVPSGNLMFILDASGSMWGKAEGRAKIAIAKEVLTGLIRDLPERLNVGLVAYGHRRKGDCNDVEELVPLSTLNKQKLIARIKAISPKGKTPITLSVRKTAEKLKAMEDETTIILVSDGKETCAGDPCSLVKELRESGVKFVMHVIGFDVTDAEREQLECIAKAGGGTYYSAKNAGEFKMAARKVVKETQTVGFLRVKVLRNGKAIAAPIDVFIPEEEKTVATATSTTRVENPIAIRLKPGSYAVRVTDTGLPGKPSVTFPGVEIEVGKVVEKTAQFSASYLNVTAIKEGKPFKAYVWVYRQAEEDALASGWTDKDKPASYSLLPGTYDIKVQDSSVPDKPIVNMKGVEIKAGETVDKVAEFTQEGILRIMSVKAGKPFKGYVYIYRQGEKDAVTAGWLRKDTPRDFKLLPGAYDIKVQDSSVPDRPEVNIKDVDIKAGETVDKVAEFTQEGILEITAVKAGKPFKAYVYIYRQGEKDAVTAGWLRKDTPRDFKLLPGLYDIKVQDSSVPDKPIVNIKGVEIKAGETVDKVAEFTQEGILRIMSVKAGKPFKGYVYIYRQGEKDAVTAGWLRKDTPRDFKLLPGLYDIKVQDSSVPDRPVVNIKGVEIKAGETVEKIAEFTQEGILQIIAVKAGKPFKAYVSIYQQGEKNSITSGWLRKDKARDFKLLPGVYDIKVQDSADKTVKEIKGVAIESGKTQTIKVTF